MEPRDHQQLQRPTRQWHDTTPDSGRASKRARITGPSHDLDAFSSAEQTLLRGAAEVLGIPVSHLLRAAATELTTPESGSDGWTRRSDSSATIQNDSSFWPESTEDPQNSDGALQQIHDVGTAPFALRLPDPLERARARKRKSPGALPTVTEADPNVPASGRAPIGETGTVPYSPEVPPWLDSVPSFDVARFEATELDFQALGFDETNDTTLTFDPGLSFLSGMTGPIPEIDLGALPASGQGELAPERGHGINITEPLMLPTTEVPNNPPAQGLDKHDVTAEAIQGNSGNFSLTATPSPQGRPTGRKRRGPFKDAAKQAETGLTRKLRACIRCSLQRIRCVVDPDQPDGCCRTCIEAAPTRLSWLPCLRYRVTDAQLLDHGVCPRPTWSLRWKKMEPVEINTWASTEVKTITITQDVSGTCYNLRVRKFVPAEGDSLARKWKTNGVEQSYECTPYAMADMAEAGRTLAKFVDATLERAVCYYIDESDKLLRDTYKMALRYATFAEREKERLLLRAVLRLWCASRMESRSDRICSEETLGMQPRDYGPTCANSGLILTPPVFSAQMEVVMTANLLLPAKREVLRRLKDLIQEQQRRSWFTIYLSMFILLHSCAMLTAGDSKKARKQGMERRFFRPPLVEELCSGAKILLAYFHYCNKGGQPFAMDWSSPDQMARAELNAEQIEFIRNTTKEIETKADTFQKIKKNGDLENEYYFVSQLYDLNWRPSNIASVT